MVRLNYLTKNGLPLIAACSSETAMTIDAQLLKIATLLALKNIRKLNKTLNSWFTQYECETIEAKC